MIEDLPVLERVVIEPENIDLNLYKKIGEEITRVVDLRSKRSRSFQKQSRRF
jgi:hypothetical protein